MYNAKGRLIQIKENGHRLFLDPSRPVWFVVNREGADVIEGLMNGDIVSEHAENMQFLEELNAKDLIGKAALEVEEYAGRGGFINSDFLEELWLHVTDSCNLACKHCLVNAGKNSPGNARELSTEEIGGIIDQARLMGTGRFYFSGGEPFMRRDIFDLIEKVTEKDQLAILTNGSMIKKNQERIRKLRNRNRILFQISLESDKESVHDDLRSEGSFKSALEGIKALTALDMTPVVAMTMTRKNISDVSAVNKMLKDLGIRFHHLIWLHKRGRAVSEEDLFVSTGEIASALEQLRLTSQQTGVAVTLQKAACVRVGGRRDTKYDLCHAGISTLAVGPDGRAYPCGALVGEARLACGSVLDRGLKNVWENDRVLKSIRETSQIDTPKCGSCPYRFYCGGGCISYKYYHSGRVSGEDLYCSAYKKLYERALVDTVRERCASMKPIKDRPYLYAASCPPETLPPGRDIDVRSFHCACVLTTNDDCRKTCG